MLLTMFASRAYTTVLHVQVRLDAFHVFHHLSFSTARVSLTVLWAIPTPQLMAHASKTRCALSISELTACQYAQWATTTTSKDSAYCAPPAVSNAPLPHSAVPALRAIILVVHHVSSSVHQELTQIACWQLVLTAQLAVLLALLLRTVRAARVGSSTIKLHDSA